MYLYVATLLVLEGESTFTKFTRAVNSKTHPFWYQEGQDDYTIIKLTLLSVSLLMVKHSKLYKCVYCI
jgi:hypothetical protein